MEELGKSDETISKLEERLHELEAQEKAAKKNLESKVGVILEAKGKEMEFQQRLFELTSEFNLLEYKKAESHKKRKNTFHK